MPERQRYSKAPIVEASIGLGVDLPEGFLLEQLEPLSTLIGQEYPEREPAYLSGAATGQGNSNTTNGFRFTSEDGKRILQAGIGVFAFSVLAPYDCWENFRDEARRLWNAYREVCEPRSVTRVGVRYIDRFNLPYSETTVKDHLRITPSVPPEMPRGKMSNYFLQVQLPQDDLNCILVLNSGLVPPPEAQPDTVSVMLDFDLSRDSWDDQDDEAPWNFLEKLHVRNNEIFESCITDAMREIIK